MCIQLHEILIWLHANIKETHQPADQPSLISSFVIQSLDGIKLAKCNIYLFYIVGLRLKWSQPQRRFLAMRHIKCTM